jgi:hypothetical protein
MPGSGSASNEPPSALGGGPGSDAVLDDLEAGRLTAQRALSLLSAPVHVRRRHPAAWVRFEILNDGRRWGLRAPALAVAALVVGAESVAYPVAWLALRLLAHARGAERLGDVVSAVPAFPLTRLALAIVGAGAPFVFCAEDGDDGILISVE